MKTIKLSLVMTLSAIAFVNPSTTMMVYAEVTNFGHETPEVKELVSALKPKLRFRGIRPVSTEPPTVSMNIKFSFNSYELDSSSRETLDNLSKALLEPELENSSFLIEGHTDATGSDQYNLSLSEKRARSVKEYLIKHGVGDKQLRSVGRGEEQLLINVKPTDALNRRVMVMNTGD